MIKIFLNKLLKIIFKTQCYGNKHFGVALGGVTFSSVMNKAGEFINKRLDKDWTSAEKQRENELLGRTATFQAYTRKT